MLFSLEPSEDRCQRGWCNADCVPLKYDLFFCQGKKNKENQNKTYYPPSQIIHISPFPNQNPKTTTNQTTKNLIPYNFMGHKLRLEELRMSLVQLRRDSKASSEVRLIAQGLIQSDPEKTETEPSLPLLDSIQGKNIFIDNQNHLY